MCHFTSRSRHAGTRDSIDEPNRLLRDARQPFVRCCRRDKKNRIQFTLVKHLNPRLSFLRNQIRDEHCVHSSLLSLDCQPIFAKLQKWIEIAEEYDWHIDALSCAAHACERVAECNAIPQRALRSALNDLAVGYRITEWNAKLDNVRTGRPEFD